MRPPAAFQLVLRVLLGGIFIVSGFQKLVDSPENFKAVVEQYELLKGESAVWVAHALPWFEFVLGVFFTAGLWTRASMAALWAMNTGFIVLLVSALARKLPIEQCGCLGKALTLSPHQMLGVDGAIWGLFLVYFLLNRRSPAPSLDNRLNRHG